MRVVLTVEGDLLLEVANGDAASAADFIVTLEHRRGRGTLKALPAGKGVAPDKKPAHRPTRRAKRGQPVKPNGQALSEALHEVWAYMVEQDEELRPTDIAQHLHIANTAATARMGELYRRGWVYRPRKGVYRAHPSKLETHDDGKETDPTPAA